MSLTRQSSEFQALAASAGNPRSPSVERRVVGTSKVDVSAEMLKPRGQTGLQAKNLASTSNFSPRPQNILARTASFGHYRTSSHFWSQAPMNRPNNFCYITYINSDTFDHFSFELAKLYCDFSLCCGHCLIDCFASRQALLQSREFSRRAV